MNDLSLLSRGLLVFALLGGAVATQKTLHQFLGSGVDDKFGTSVAGAGDVNADGYADLIIGAPGDDTNGNDAGSVRVVSGIDGSTLFTFFGDDAGDLLGQSVGGAGDVNGDGFADLIAGAPGDDNTGSDAGSVRVYSGADGSVLWAFDGDGAGDALGTSVAAPGDVNNDGYADLLAGAPGDDNTGVDAGSARIWSGLSGTVLWTFDGDGAGDRFGFSVGGAGDFDNTGGPDVVVGAPMDDDTGANAGRAFVYSGTTGARLATMSGGAPGDNFGWSVSGAGDVNGDGFADVVVGSPFNDDRGADAGVARVHVGPVGLLLFAVLGQQAGDNLGFCVAGAGDVDADGRADVLVGAPQGDGLVANGGDARIVSGATGRRMRLLASGTPATGFGSAVAGAGDVDGDGYADVIVGAPFDSSQASSAGAAQVFGQAPYEMHSNVLTLLPSASPASNFGVAVGPVGDVDNDGIADYIIGAPGDIGGLGAAYVYSGDDHSVIRSVSGASPGTLYGNRVGTAGDIDQDGHADIIVGAIHDDTVLQDCGAAYVYSGATGVLLQAVFGTQFRSHLGSAVGGIGDVNGDSIDDYYVGLGVHNTEDGEVWVMSGATATRIYRVLPGVADGWFGWSGASLPDLDGDGFRDFVVGVPEAISGGTGFARLLSGRTGATIRDFVGTDPGSLFGWTVAAAGDVNSDGVMDIIVGGYEHDLPGKTKAGIARVYSGQTGAILYTITGQQAGDNLGLGVCGAGDVDGDGFADFIVGAPGADPNGLVDSGSIYLYAGVDGRLLQRFDGAAAGDGLGRSVLTVGDASGDGYSEFVGGAPFVDTAASEAGASYVFESSTRSDPGAFWIYGAGCPASNAKLPNIGFGNRPILASAFQTKLSAALPGGPVFLGLDFFRQSIPLAIIGAPGCTSLALPTFALGAVADVHGRASVGIGVPASPTLIGAQLYVQWLVIDGPANPLGLVLSNAGRITFGH